MAKKDFTAEFNELLGVAPQPATDKIVTRHISDAEAPTTKDKPKRKPQAPALTKNAQAEEQRCTFVLDADILSRLRNAAYMETGKQGARVTIKDVLTEALQQYLGKKGY